MFRRSYEVTYGEDDKRHYLSDVLLCLTKFPRCMRLNHRPYDRYRDQHVKTLHYVVWYDTTSPLATEHIRRMLIEQGFFVQENPKHEKSIHEVDHFHAVKILSR